MCVCVCVHIYVYLKEKLSYGLFDIKNKTFPIANSAVMHSSIRQKLQMQQKPYANPTVQDAFHSGPGLCHQSVSDCTFCLTQGKDEGRKVSQ